MLSENEENFFRDFFCPNPEEESEFQEFLSNDEIKRGFVKDYYTNIPIGGVKVQNQNNIVYTDSLGYYEINELPYGNVTLNFDKVNYSAADYTFSLQQGDTINFNPKLAQTLIDTIYYNPFDRGLSFGDGVFRTFLVKNGEPIKRNQ